MTITAHPDHRLRKHADFQRVYKESRRQNGRQMAWFSAPSPAPTCPGPQTRIGLTVPPAPVTARIGLTVPKAIGNAVTRNRIKRRMRAAVRKNIPALTVPVDVVLHPRRTAAEVDFHLLDQEIATIFARIHRDFTKPKQP